MQTRQFPYPYNMALAMSDMQEKLKQKVLDWEEIRLVQDSKKTYFVSEERYNTGSTLFYIPVASLYRMLHDRNRKKTAHLLLSVSAYLYHIADVPYYRQEASYLYWMYEMLNDWVEQDDYTPRFIGWSEISRWMGLPIKYIAEIQRFRVKGSRKVGGTTPFVRLPEYS